jgi:hypothetical protein
VTRGWPRRRVLAAVLATSTCGCAGVGRDRDAVTPAPVPTTAETSDRTGVDLAVRNESPYRRSVVLVVERDGTARFRRRVTVLAGRGRRFTDAVASGSVADSGDDLTVAVERTTGTRLAERVIRPGGLRAVVVTLLPNRIEWTLVPAQR